MLTRNITANSIPENAIVTLRPSAQLLGTTQHAGQVVMQLHSDATHLMPHKRQQAKHAYDVFQGEMTSLPTNKLCN